VTGRLEGSGLFKVNVGSLVSPVSVIVATHNHGPYLGGTLAAVESQEDVILELIVVDDASTDGTEWIVREFAARTRIPFTYVRLPRRGGQAIARNRGIDLARGEFIAFTDADCVPSPRWIVQATATFEERPSLGMVQGRTQCLQEQPAMFTHFIETLRFDNSFSTSNIVYRRSAIGPHRFDPSCIYWEDTELGFEARADGWEVDFCPDALVYHQVVPQTVGSWLMWPKRYVNWPAKVARYPEFRRTLFLKAWVRPLHACFDVALGGVVAFALGRRRIGVLLCVPYVLAFARAHGVRGRAPCLKVLLHVARDTVASCSLLVGSLRYRRVVL
jgi:glycosyltransferase involved in cell wall biosynthesis